MRVAIELAFSELPEDVKIVIISSEHEEKGDDKCVLDACIGDLNREIRVYEEEIVRVFRDECSLEELVRSVNKLLSNYQKKHRLIAR